MKQTDSIKRDACILNFLKEHRGNENAVHSADIIKHLDSCGFTVTGSNNLRPIIRRIMYEYNAPICHKTWGGYYWAKTREDVLIAIADLESRIESLTKHAEHLKNFIID
jgi:hypothetical protein